MRLHGLLALALSLLLACVGAAHAAPPDAAAAFARLAALQGEWAGRFANGREHRVSYRVSAGGTVVVETWALAPGRESMTVYHLDGERLLATHYCPQGTQPRLQLVEADKETMRFALIDGAGLDVPGRSHQARFRMRLQSPARFVRNEAYVENGAPPDHAVDDPDVVYTRVDPPSA